MIPSSRRFAALGRVFQIGFVVKDIDEALQYWTQVIGAGPFYLARHMSLGTTSYRGQPVQIDMAAAMGYWGDIQIELIQQHCNTPSVYLEWYQAGGQGIHHIGVVVESYEDAYASLIAANGASLQEIFIPGRVRAAYFELPQQPDPIIEFLEVTPPVLEGWAKWRKTTAEWDGVTAPIRDM